MDRIPVTTPARALRDVAASTSHRVLRNLVIDAEQRGLVTLDDLREQCARRRTAPGGKRFRDVVGGRTRDRSDSGFEADVRAALTAAGLEVTSEPVAVACPDGSTLFADIGVVGTNVVLECDGKAFHESRRAFARDRQRWLLLQEAGRHIVWVTVDMLDTPDRLVQHVRTAIDLAHPSATA